MFNYSKKNELELFAKKVDSLYAKQSDAVGLITSTVNNLKDINEEIINEVSIAQGKINELNRMNDNLLNLKHQNQALIKNFNQLLEV